MMRAATALAALAALVTLASCGHMSAPDIYRASASDYRWHKNTADIRVHWNYLRGGDGSLTAEGFVEPFNQNACLHHVSLELVGLDAEGRVVSSAAGRPADEYIVPPSDNSPFSITLQPAGTEKRFTVRGRYYHYAAGTMPEFSARSVGRIPVKSNEPY